MKSASAIGTVVERMTRFTLLLHLPRAHGALAVQEAIVAALFCPNILLELSTLMPHHVLEVMKHLPSSRLMIGSDLPENLETEIGKILTLDVPELDKRNILYETAAGIFHE